MREIKFRVFTFDKMLYLDKYDFVIYGDGSPRENNYGDMIGFCKPSPLMQYTGLKDRNDVEIYEGDIIKLSDEYGGWSYPNLVVESGYACFQLYSVINNGNKIPFTNISIDYYEVIGNIYENPELLENK